LKWLNDPNIASCSCKMNCFSTLLTSCEVSVYVDIDAEGGREEGREGGREGGREEGREVNFIKMLEGWE
jgi:predicted transposase YdaD